MCKYLCNIQCVMCKKRAVVITLFVRNDFHVLASAIRYCFYTVPLPYCETISLTVLGRFAVSFHASVQCPMVCLNGSNGVLASQFHVCRLLWH